MKNADHPLIRALGSKKAKLSSPVDPFSLPEKRSFEAKHSDHAGFPNLKVGSGIRIKLKGIVASQNKDGRMIIDVDEVVPDEGVDDNETKEPQVLNVRTQQTQG